MKLITEWINLLFALQTPNKRHSLDNSLDNENDNK